MKFCSSCTFTREHIAFSGLTSYFLSQIFSVNYDIYEKLHKAQFLRENLAGQILGKHFSTLPLKLFLKIFRWFFFRVVLAKYVQREKQSYYISYCHLNNLKFPSQLSINWGGEILTCSLKNIIERVLVQTCIYEQGVVACTCNSSTLEEEFRKGVYLLPVGSSSPSIGEWIIWPPVIWCKARNLTKYWDLAGTYQRTEISSRVKLATVR